MWPLTDQKLRVRRKSTNWPKIGPLGRDIDRVFSNLVYRHTSSPLPLTVWCSQDTIIILAETHNLESNEIDITVADQTLLLTITPDPEEIGEEAQKAHQQATKTPHAIPLLYRIDVNQIDAGFENNLLHIKLPRLRMNNTAENTIQYIQ